MPYMLLILDKYSSFNRLIRTTAWVFRFVNGCRTTITQKTDHLELVKAEKADRYWVAVARQFAFPEELICLQKRGDLSSKSRLLVTPSRVGCVWPDQSGWQNRTFRPPVIFSTSSCDRSQLSRIDQAHCTNGAHAPPTCGTYANW